MRALWLMGMLAIATAAQAGEVTILNASYDPTRELYADYNHYFAEQWQQKTGDAVHVRMSHAGSGAQARAINEGLPADVATLALGADLDAIAATGKLRSDWEQALPDHAAPYRSVIVLLVRKGNPKAIHDWNDLARPDVAVLTPNPKTSGGARWNYLAALAYAQKNYTPEAARLFMKAWIHHVLLFDSGARAATTNFVRRHRGDVLVTWENEAYVAQHYFGKDAFEIVMPSVTVLAEPPVAVIDAVADKRGTRAVAQAYIDGLYSPAGQQIIADHAFRPIDSSAKSNLPPLTGITVKTIRDFGGWQKAQQAYFADGGQFDQLSAEDR